MRGFNLCFYVRKIYQCLVANNFVNINGRNRTIGYISMGNQMMTSKIRQFHAHFVQNNYLILHKKQVKLFSNFTSIPFD